MAGGKAVRIVPDEGVAQPDMVDVILEHGCNGPFTIVAGQYMFEEGKPNRVPRAFAEALVGGNPEPWQVKGGGDYDVYKIVVSTPGRTEESATDEQ